MLACSIEIYRDRPVSSPDVWSPEVEALFVPNRRRSGGAGAGSAMRRRPSSRRTSADARDRAFPCDGEHQNHIVFSLVNSGSA
jgi:hypothetical protein